MLNLAYTDYKTQRAAQNASKTKMAIPTNDVTCLEEVFPESIVKSDFPFSNSCEMERKMDEIPKEKEAAFEDYV